MNKTIKNTRVVDHSRTESILREVMGNVRAQGNTYMNYIKKMDENKDKSMYSEQYLKEINDKEYEKLVSVSRINADNFYKLISEAKEVELKNSLAPLNIADPAIQSAMIVINTMGDKMDSLTFESIVRLFIGQKNALDFISNILRKHDIEPYENMKKYFYDSKALFETLDEALANLTLFPKEMAAYQNVQREIIEVASRLGVELSDDDLDMGIPAESAFLANMKLAAGLGAELAD